MLWRGLGLLLVYALALVGADTVINAIIDRPSTSWAVVMDVDDDPMDAKIVQYVRNREQCIDTAQKVSDRYFRAHPGADTPPMPRCARIDRYWRHANRTSIQFVDE